MRRVSMIGIAGSGKSTLARELAAILGLDHTELDSILHQAGWISLPDEEFRRRVAALAARDRWVLDGNYSGQVQPIIWAWRMHGVQRARYTAAMADPAHGHLRFVRLRSPGEVRRFRRRLARTVRR